MSAGAAGFFQDLRARAGGLLGVACFVQDREQEHATFAVVASTVMVYARGYGHRRNSRAEDEGTTVRTILLRILKEAGLAELDDAEIVDRRTTPERRLSGR